MSDRALSEAAMLTSLRDIRLPVEAAGGMAADIAAALGLAGLAALIVAGLLRLLAQRRPRTTQTSLQDRLAALEALPEDARRVAMLHLLRAQDPARYAAIKGTLYQPGGGADLATLEAEVARLA